MTPNEYQHLALTTEAPIADVAKRLGAEMTAEAEQKFRLLHAAMGMATEAGELVDMLKRHLFYGTKMDTLNAQEEFGDAMYYIAVGVDAINQLIQMSEDDVPAERQLEAIMMQNIAKLKKRYPNRFDVTAATQRDTAAERAALEHGRSE